MRTSFFYFKGAEFIDINNLINEIDCSILVNELKVIIQSYMQRMNRNELVLSD